MKEKVSLADDAREIARVTKKEATVVHEGREYRLKRPHILDVAEVWDALADKKLKPMTRAAKVMTLAVERSVVSIKDLETGEEREGISPDESADFFLEVAKAPKGYRNPVVAAAYDLCGIPEGKKAEAEEEIVPRPT